MTSLKLVHLQMHWNPLTITSPKWRRVAMLSVLWSLIEGNICRHERTITFTIVMIIQWRSLRINCCTQTHCSSMAMKSLTSSSYVKMILHEDIDRYTITLPSAILDSNYSFICFATTSCDNAILFPCKSCNNRVEQLDRQTTGSQ